MPDREAWDGERYVDLGDFERELARSVVRPPAWRMCAHRYGDGLLHNVGSRRFVKAHGIPDPIVEVEVREVERDSPDATHWAWFDAKDTEPCMIYPRRVLFDICFPYGPQVEEKRGKGRIVRLAVTEVADA